MRRHECAHTLIELLAVLSIVATLAVSLDIRFPAFAARDAGAQGVALVAALRYARRLAVTSGCATGVRIDQESSHVELLRWPHAATCAVPAGQSVSLHPPGAGHWHRAQHTRPAFSRDLEFYFDAEGSPRAMDGRLVLKPRKLEFSVAGQRLRIVPRTGLVLRA